MPSFLLFSCRRDSVSDYEPRLTGSSLIDMPFGLLSAYGWPSSGDNEPVLTAIADCGPNSSSFLELFFYFGISRSKSWFLAGTAIGLGTGRLGMFSCIEDFKSPTVVSSVVCIRVLYSLMKLDVGASFGIS